MDDLVDRIQAIRSRNNEHWMDLLRLALEAQPSKARHLLSQIAENDEQVLTLTKRISRDSG